MKKIYQNFDKMEVTFQCIVPKHIINKIREAQQEAKQLRRDAYIKLGESKAYIAVAESGMKGGFTYRICTGDDGIIFAIRDSEDPFGWNVKASISSLMLAIYGYKETKEKLLSFLIDDLMAKAATSQSIPTERVSRFDFCIDFLSQKDFVPDPKCFFVKNRSKKRYQGNIPNLSPLDFFIIDQGKDIQTITIGTMPNRQITIYNKSREIKYSQKTYWWNLWGLDSSKTKGDIWRVEVRLGKKELNKWNIRRFSDFEKKAGDAIIHMLKDYRYVIPNLNDSNRARWRLEPFWQDCIDAAKDYLAEYICNAERNEIQLILLGEMQKRYHLQLCGMMPGYAACHGYDISEIPAVLDIAREEIIGTMRSNPKKFQLNYNKSEKKFEYLQGKKQMPITTE